MGTRRRIDTLLCERGLARSRSAAASSVRAGRVRIGAGRERALKPSQLVSTDVELELEAGPRFVSRGGEKLDPVLDRLAVDPAGRDCLDVGAATGGFTDCLLRRGAARVIALDVGRGQLDWKLRNDPRVAVLEGVNARRLKPATLPWVPSLATIDVSFIGLAKVLGPVARCLGPEAVLVALVKPQFELGPHRVGRGGVVRDRDDVVVAVLGVAEAAAREGLATVGIAAAGLPGPKGNREVFLHLRTAGSHPGLAGEELTAAARTAVPG